YDRISGAELCAGVFGQPPAEARILSRCLSVELLADGGQDLIGLVRLGDKAHPCEDIDIAPTAAWAVAGNEDHFEIGPGAAQFHGQLAASQATGHYHVRNHKINLMRALSPNRQRRGTAVRLDYLVATML